MDLMMIWISSVSDAEDQVIYLQIVMLRNIRRDTIWIRFITIQFISIYLIINVI